MQTSGLLGTIHRLLGDPLARRVASGLWLLALALYTIAGAGLAPFHGDESMQVYASHDFTTAILDGHPERLETQPPYVIDSDAHLRIINGSVSRYTIGLAWYLAGMHDSDLPHLWLWPADYATNLAAGNRPSDRLLAVARIPPALFLALSIVVMFGLGYAVEGRLGAVVASGLYGLNPVILLNGRRAWMEASLLCFGLLAVAIAFRLGKRLSDGDRRGLWVEWLALALSAGLALASKHTAAVFLAAAWLVVALTALVRQRGANPARVWLALVASGVAALAIFVALSPALWSDPLARLGDLIAARRELLASQVSADPAAPTTLGQRLAGMVAGAYLAPPQYFEAAFWADFAPISAEIRAYEASGLAGLPAGLLLGLPLSLLSGWGLFVATRSTLAGDRAAAHSLGVLVWFGVAAASALVNPLPWQRYDLPLIPVVILLTVVGLRPALASLARISRQSREF